MNPDTFVPVAPTTPPTQAVAQSFPIAEWLVWAIVLVMALMLVGYGIVLTYHWIQYSHSRAAALTSTSVYFLGGAVLVLIMLFAGMSL